MERRWTPAAAVGLLLAGGIALAVLGVRSLRLEREESERRARVRVEETLGAAARAAPTLVAGDGAASAPLLPGESWTFLDGPGADPLSSAPEDDRLLLDEAAWRIRARDDIPGARSILERLAGEGRHPALRATAALRGAALARRAGDGAAAARLLAVADEAPEDLWDGAPARAAALYLRARGGDGEAADRLVAASAGGHLLGGRGALGPGDLVAALAEEIGTPGSPTLSPATASLVQRAAAVARRGAALAQAVGTGTLAVLGDVVAVRDGATLHARHASGLSPAFALALGPGAAPVHVASDAASVPAGALRIAPAPPLDGLLLWSVAEPDSGAGSAVVALAAGLAVYVLGAGFALVALRRSARAARMQSDFVAAVSHEMKTPIAGVQAMAEMLAQGRVAGPEKAREYAERIRAEMQRLGATVRNALDAARIERGAGPLVAPRRMDPVTVVETVAGVVRPVLEARGFAFDVDARPAARPLPVDPDALTSVLVNLLDNAAKFAGDRREVAVRAGPHGAGYRVEVLDRGPGVPAADRRRVFQRFYRGEAARHGAVPGVGLGLHVAHELVAAHGGSLTVTDREGGGATFVVDIPEVAA